jgi:hypothetical protein
MRHCPFVFRRHIVVRNHISWSSPLMRPRIRLKADENARSPSTVRFTSRASIQNRPVPEGKPAGHSFAGHPATTQRRRQLVDHSVRRVGLDNGVCVVVGMRFYKSLKERFDLGFSCCRTHRIAPFEHDYFRFARFAAALRETGVLFFFFRSGFGACPFRGIG